MLEREGPRYNVFARRYKVQHSVLPMQLRPAWQWEQQSRSWKVHETTPPAVHKADTAGRERGGKQQGSKPSGRAKAKGKSSPPQKKPPPPKPAPPPRARPPPKPKPAAAEQPAEQCPRHPDCTRPARHPGQCRLQAVKPAAGRRSVEPGPPFDGPPAEGELCAARFGGGDDEPWTAATVLRVHDGGDKGGGVQVDVRYEDGEVEERKPFARIARRLGGATAALS